MWIKATLKSGDAVHCNTQNIAAVFKSQDRADNGMTVIQFDGSCSNYVLVTESVEEIIGMISVSSTYSLVRTTDLVDEPLCIGAIDYHTTE